MQSPDSHACHTAVMTGPPHHSLQVGMVGMALVTGSVLASLLESSDLCWAMGSLRTSFLVLFLFILLIDFGERKERHQLVTYAFIGWFSHDRGWNLQPWHIRTTLQPSSVSVLSLLRCDLPSGSCVVHSLGALPGGCSQSKKATPRLHQAAPLAPPGAPASQLTALWGEARTSGFPRTFILFI